MAALAAAVVLGLWSAVYAETRQAEVDDNFYLPVVVDVRQGDAVFWRHVGSAPHSITHQANNEQDEKFDSHPDCGGTPINPLDCMTTGDTYEVTLTESGSVPYFCKVHGRRDVPPDPARGPQDQPCGMCGLIRVLATTTPPPSATMDPSTPPPAATPVRTRGPTPEPTVEQTPSPAPSPAPPSTSDPEPTRTPGSFAAPDEDAGVSRGRILGLVAAALVLISAGGLAWWSLLRSR